MSNIRRNMQTPMSIPFIYAFLNSEKMNCVEDPEGDLGGIYVGSLQSANDAELLRKNGIRAVLTVASGTGLAYPKSMNMVQHLILQADDVPSFDISKHFETGINFIARNRKLTNVLVHCHAGISRSSTVVIAFLMKTKGWSCERVLNEVRKRRQIISPNPGFIRHLLNFEKYSQKPLRKLNVSNQNKYDSMFQTTKPIKPAELLSSLTPSNARLAQSVSKKNQTISDKDQNANPLNLKGNNYFEKKKPLQAEQRQVAKQSAKKMKNQEVTKQPPKMNTTNVRDHIGTKEPPQVSYKNHMKSASVAKQSKINYHYSRDRNSQQKSMAQTTEQKGMLFGKLLNGYRGPQFNGTGTRNLL